MKCAQWVAAVGDRNNNSISRTSAKSRTAIFHYGAGVFVLPRTELLAFPIPVLVVFVQNFIQSALK